MPVPDDAVLDASAVLVLLQGEPGAERVARCIPGAQISAVNLAEVVGKLADSGMPVAQIERALSALALRVVPVDAPQAWAIGRLRPTTRGLGLSLGDRACLALGQSTGLVVLTADRAWADVDIDVTVELVR